MYVAGMNVVRINMTHSDHRDAARIGCELFLILFGDNAIIIGARHDPRDSDQNVAKERRKNSERKPGLLRKSFRNH